jgi:hypothetical protein
MAIRPAQGAVFQRLHSGHPQAPAELELVLYHDVLCSWCYVADGRLEYLRDEYGPTLRWNLRPYPLRPENQIPDRKQRTVLARPFRRLARDPGGKASSRISDRTGSAVQSLPLLVALAALPQDRAAARVARRDRGARRSTRASTWRATSSSSSGAQVGLDLGRLVSS